jgi:cupin fold WbuC family metalloprotein
VTTHDDDGAVIGDVVLSQESGNYEVDILKGVWHMVEALELGSFVFECEAGAFATHDQEGIL